MQQCDTLSGGFRTSQTISEISLNIGDRVQDNNTGLYYTVINSNATTGGFVTATNTGLTGCPEPAQYYYAMQKCDDNVIYQSQQSNEQITFNLGDVVTAGGGVYFTIIDTNIALGVYTQYSLPVSLTSLSGCPLGTYGCNTYNDWVTVNWNSGTGVVTVNPVRNTTTVQSFTPTNTTSGQGIVTITYSFSDSNPLWDNTDEIITGCQVQVDTGTGAVVYRATFVTCDDPAGFIVNVFSSQPISTTQVLSDANECYQFVNNNGGTPEQDISEFTLYNSGSTSGENCIACNDAVNPTTTTTTLAPCFPINIYATTTNPATDSAAMEIVCGGGGARTRTAYFNTNDLSTATAWYTDEDCTTLRSTHGYLSAAGNTSEYYYWNGSSMTLIGNTSCQ